MNARERAPKPCAGPKHFLSAGWSHREFRSPRERVLTPEQTSRKNTRIALEVALFVGGVATIVFQNVNH